MKQFIKRLFCKHNYIMKAMSLPYNELETGVRVQRLQCNKCGKTKINITFI